MANDPYKILELPFGTAFNEVRIKYYKIARLHHPDKFSGTDEEKKANEDYFKKVTVAYRRIELSEQNGIPIDITRDNDSDSIFQTFSTFSKDDWRSVWSSVDSFFSRPEIWDSMKTILIDKFKDIATKTIKKNHRVKVPLKYEDVYNAKMKKLRLFLDGIDEPVFIQVNAANFPHTLVKYTCIEIHGREVELEITLDFELIEHPIYRYDNLFETCDLHADVKLTLSEYILGKKHMLPFLDGSEVAINIPPFNKDKHHSIIISGKGLHKNKGNLYVFIDIILPDKKIWDLQNVEFKEKLLKSLNMLYIN
jgi:DnaJ-class molecular chaperone